MISLNEFLERMDHEFECSSEIRVGREGYKTDTGRGIKNYLKIQGLKSVDYYEVHDNKGLLFVEFSDLFWEKSDIDTRLDALESCDLCDEYKRATLSELKKRIHQGLASKFKDSHTLKDIVINKFTDVPLCFKEIGAYIVVVPPIRESVDTEKYQSLIRFLSILESKIKGAIPNDIYTNVRVLPLDRFIAA
ncbi:hypothetical protein [Vibrio cholerae]|uniref:hypothetical protein n=1 Tax=Vibrio cholerae TaxID=666 RepID=UPI00115762B5|nr:hypothetical protein [Vibrio cholerae]TQQ11746.1 hypothetical protein FLL71_06060 [Vibrio cholerae]